MNTKRKPVGAPEVERFLLDNPAFLADHPHILIEQDLGGDESRPFYQRQLQVLRERSEAQQTRLSELEDNVRSNQAIESALHRFALALLTGSRGDREAIVGLIEQHFSLEHVRLLTDQPDPSDQSDQSDPSDSNSNNGLDYPSLLARVQHLASVCDDRVSMQLRTALFGAAAAGLRSIAFVPVASGQELRGVLVLADSAHDRFEPGLGVALLDKLGQLVAAGLEVG